MVKFRGRKRERVIRVLLNQPDGSLKKLHIAQLSGCSREWVIEFLHKSEGLGLTRNTRVTDYGGLIRYWHSIRIANEYRDYMLPNPLQSLRDAGLKYALTTYQAESLLQHYLFPSRTDAYVLIDDRGEWHRRIVDFGGLVGKGNLRLLFTDNYQFHDTIVLEGYTIVSRPQLIVDLLAEGGPCTEAAQLLLEKVTKHALRAS